MTTGLQTVLDLAFLSGIEPLKTKRIGKYMIYGGMSWTFSCPGYNRQSQEYNLPRQGL